MKRRTLDCRGLLCPLPVLEAAKALKKLKPPFELLVLSDDPVALRDFRLFAKKQRLKLGRPEEFSYLLSSVN
jgi:tRNA 2-thiouridine synthesizing protein A